LVTNQYIFNIKQKKIIRRQIKIVNLSGITINLKNENELLLHVHGEHDFLLKTESRKVLVDTLKILFIKN